MNTIDQELLDNPFWEETDPAKMRLVHLSHAFPKELNPFADDGVVIRAAGVPGSESPHSKWPVGRAAVLDGIKRGKIHKGTTVVEATSANTGQSEAATCTALGLDFLAIMKGDTPATKVAGIQSFGERVKIDLVFDSAETTVERARRLGKEPGYYNPDQYGGDWNWQTQRDYLAAQLFALQPDIAILAAPAGTMGTTIGFWEYAHDHGLDTLVLPVMCAKGEEVPGARTRSSIEADIRFDWQRRFKDIETGPRYASFLLSYLSWPAVPQLLGPSFGLGFYGALHFLDAQKKAGTLERFRRADGTIPVVVFGPDSYLLYTSLYPAVLTFENMAKREPISLEKLFALK